MDGQKKWAEAARLLEGWREEVDAELVSLRQYLDTLEEENWEIVASEQALLVDLRTMLDTTGQWLERRKQGELEDSAWLVKWMNERLAAILERALSMQASPARKAVVAALKGGSNDSDQGSGDTVD